MTRGAVRIQAYPGCPKSALNAFPSLRVTAHAKVTVRISFLGHGLRCLRMSCFHTLPALEPALEMTVAPCKLLLDSIDDRLLSRYLNHVRYLSAYRRAHRPYPSIYNAVLSVSRVTSFPS